MVIITRSNSSGVNISITAELREYFKNFIKTSVSNQSLEERLCEFKGGIISKFLGRIERAKFED